MPSESAPKILPTAPVALKDAGADSHAADNDLGAIPPVLTSKEVARILRVGVREVRSLVASGELAGARVGPRKVIRVSKRALLALLKVRDAI
jgi:excisionase family DNA binding protein